MNAGAAALTGEQSPQDDDDRVIHLDTHPQLLDGVVPFLDLHAVQALSLTSKTIHDVIFHNSGPKSIHVAKPPNPLDASLSSSCGKTFAKLGEQLQQLTFVSATFAETSTFPSLLGFCGNLRRLTIHDCKLDQWNPESE